jgi:hypothetical protein
MAKFWEFLYTFSLSVYIEIFKKIKIVINKYYFFNYKIIDNKRVNIFTKFYAYYF